MVWSKFSCKRNCFKPSDYPKNTKAEVILGAIENLFEMFFKFSQSIWKFIPLLNLFENMKWLSMWIVIKVYHIYFYTSTWCVYLKYLTYVPKVPDVCTSSTWCVDLICLLINPYIFVLTIGWGYGQRLDGGWNQEPQVHQAVDPKQLAGKCYPYMLHLICIIR